MSDSVMMDTLKPQQSCGSHAPIDPNTPCFHLTRYQLIPFWCFLSVLTVTVFLINWYRSLPKATVRKYKDGLKSLLQRLKGGAKVNPLKVELLNNAEQLECGNAGVLESCVKVSPTQMASICTDMNISKGLEAATLSVLLVVQHRRRYGNVTVGMAVSKTHAKTVDIEIPQPATFAKVLSSVESALLEQEQDIGEEPEIVLNWNSDFSQPGQWEVKQANSMLEVYGGSPSERQAFKRLFDACSSNKNIDIWQVPLVSDESVNFIRSLGKAARDFAQFREVPGGKLLPVPRILAKPPSTPDAPAIIGEGFELSHTELRQQASAVHQAVLQNADPRRSKTVLVYMGRGAAIGPTYLGVLQAGFQVVPVDVHWPLERLKAVAEDVLPGLALVDPATAPDWHAVGESVPKVLAVDESFYATYKGQKRQVNDINAIGIEDPAIMLFTSGSTGRPKGIMLSHGYVTALVAGVGESKFFNPTTRTLCYHSPTWMPFIDYLLAPLLWNGCCLFFPENASHVVKPNELSDFAKKNKATVAGFVPAMFDIFLEQGLPETLSNIGVGGAPVPGELCIRALPAMPKNHNGTPGVLFTGYSGTEQGDVTQVQMRKESDVEEAVTKKGTMSAGKPHTAQKFAILDQGLSYVPMGAVGEICVAGPGLASGYLGLPEKTAEAFVPCKAFSGARVSRTADLGCWNAQGNLEVVGRRDSMVKVRGARIEIGEVETAVNAHPAVKTCIVTVYKDQLLAYVCPAVPGDLRDHCKQRLVAYMVPHIFEGLEEVPRLPNGKVNKKALPPPTIRTDGAETVMELDSLGQMRKFTRKAASEDRILDNVRAILIAVVIHSHSIPLVDQGCKIMPASEMIDSRFANLGIEWGPQQFFVLSLIRGGGWSSLAFLSGFDDTRSEEPYGLKYREVLFLVLWVVLDFNWTMWYLPAFVYMRAAFCWLHKAGLEKTHLVVASQLWLFVPAFVDFYIGWHPTLPGQATECPSQCFCPWQAWPGAQTIAHYGIGWWAGDGTSHSFIGHAMIFIPCYWLGFYLGQPVFTALCRLADDKNWFKRIGVSLAVFALYYVIFTKGQSLAEDFNDTCSSFWDNGRFVWMQVFNNVMYYISNLFTSLLYVIFIAAAMPIHLKYLAKVCFSSLLFSPYTPCILNTPEMALQLRSRLPASISPSVELAWSLYVPFLYTLVVGAIFGVLLPIAAKVMIKVYSKVKPGSE